MRAIEVLEEVVLTCGELVASMQEQERGNLLAQDKHEQLGQHFSTVADRESLRRGLSILRRSLPHEEIVAEEQKNAARVPPGCTVFDPLDGTTNFFNGSDDYGVTICTLRRGQPAYGATYFPALKMLISAVRGRGCFIGGFGHGERLTKIPWHGRLDKTQIGTDVGSWAHSSGSFESVLKPLSRRFNILSAVSAIEGGRRVLLGQTAAYYSLGIAKIWDAAAMALAVEEAGGVAVSPSGKPLRWGSLEFSWVLAINPKLAKVVLQHTQQI